MLDALELMDRGIETLAGRFPDVRPESSFDSVLVYSVLHCLDSEQDPLNFMITAAEHLNEAGRLLIGDIPNADKRKRFLASDFGRAFDKRWRANSGKGVSWTGDGGAGFFSEDFIFDAVEQLRRHGFEAYLLPQRPELPFSYTRDDILVIRI